MRLRKPCLWTDTSWSYHRIEWLKEANRVPQLRSGYHLCQRLWKRWLMGPRCRGRLLVECRIVHRKCDGASGATPWVQCLNYTIRAVCLGSRHQEVLSVKAAQSIGHLRKRCTTHKLNREVVGLWTQRGYY